MKSLVYEHTGEGESMYAYALIHKILHSKDD